MQIPKFWAEARRQKRTREKQVTVRRFGWSDESQEAAQEHAEERVEQALEQAWTDEGVLRREPKVAYNGAEGVPIREEIVAEHGDTIITRNSYGALCLNTPDVLFADVDFPEALNWFEGCAFGLMAALAGAAALRLYGVEFDWQIFAVLAAVWFLGVVMAYAIDMFRGGIIPSRESKAIKPIERLGEQNPQWQLRLYRTPNGYRVLAMHDLFDPTGQEAAELFKALKSDKLYVTMCRRQACFRARVSPKPWRVDVQQHLKPRPGVWPINPERLPEREAWIAEYEAASKEYASCEYLTTLGFGDTHPKCREVQQLHDKQSKAESGLPIA